MYRFSSFVAVSLLALAILGSAKKFDPKELEKFAKLNERYETLVKLFEAERAVFETLKEDNPAKLDPSIVRNLLQSFKALKIRFQHSRSTFDDFAINYIKNVDSIFRVGFEDVRIKHAMYIKAIDQIMFEILGKMSGISDFKKEEVSEKLQSVHDIASMKFNDYLKVFTDIEERLQLIQSDDQAKDLLNILQILNDFNIMIDAVKSIRQTAGMVFLDEVNRISNKGKEMDLIQKAMMDSFLALCIWYEGYAAHFQELLQKISLSAKLF